MTLRRPSTAWASLTALAIGAALPAGISAQPVQRISATVAALSAYTTFFHSRPVLLRARAEGDLRDVFVTDGERQILALNVTAPAPGEDPELLEIEGTFWDVGRLQPDDSRLDTFLIRQLSERLFNRRWPVSGELMLLIADATQRAADPESPTIQAISLEPSRYLDRPVTVIGRFRGRNLYGDLPEAPGTSQYDFVLQSGNAAIWVVDKEPRGDGFKLDVMARVDTGRWLQVTGLVTGDEQLVEIAATELEQVERPARLAPTLVTEDRRPGPSPEVIFSTPTPDDTAVGTDVLVRLQFSRDMDDESFEGNVEVDYLGAQADDEPLEFAVEYRGRNRVLSVTLDEPLRQYATLTVTLGDGILAADGATLVPYALSFSTGGS